MSEDQAKRRFLALQIIRLAGTAMAVLGLVIEGGRGPAAIPQVVAVPLVLIGAFAALYLPILLVRRWKSQDR